MKNSSRNQLRRCNVPPNHRPVCWEISRQHCHPWVGNDSSRNKGQHRLTHSQGFPTHSQKNHVMKFHVMGSREMIQKNHVMTFHLWCSSNSLMDDSVRLRLFQWTLTGIAAKRYIELPQHSFVDIGSLETMFLTHFQFSIHYEMGINLLNSLRQNTSTHISDHIHEWRRQRRLIKAPILDALLAYWLTKSLLPPIAWDVAMGGVVTEEQAISQAHYLDLVYS